MGHSSDSPGKKQKKATKDNDMRKRPSSSSSRGGSSTDMHSSATAGGHSTGQSSSTRSAVDHGMQRQKHWSTVMGSPSSSHSRNEYAQASQPPLTGSDGSMSLFTTQAIPNGRHAQPLQKAVPILPRGGAAINPRQDDDECRFKCQEEGCQQRFKHRSSRSRHKKKSHSNDANNPR